MRIDIIPTKDLTMLQTAIYYSLVSDSMAAGENGAKSILEQLNNQAPDFIFIFTSVGHEIPELIKGIRAYLPDIPLCGCSGAGTITSDGCDEMTHSLSLMAIRTNRINFYPFMCADLSGKQEQSGSEIAAMLNPIIADEKASNSQLLILFTEGLTVNVDALYRGLESNLSTHIDIVGGTAGNDFQGNKTYQFYNNTVLCDGASGVLLSGDFSYNVGVTHGSKPFGLFRTITRAEKNVIFEIDNMPALDLLKEFIGAERVEDFGQVLNLFELGEQFEGQGYDESILNRAITGIERDQGGIRLAVEIPEGTQVRITRRDMDLVLERTRQMTADLVNKMNNPDNAAYFYFNCSGRGSYLFGEPEPDVDALRDTLGQHRKMIGFFTFGEFAPVQRKNYFHNYTGVLVGLE